MKVGPVPNFIPPFSLFSHSLTGVLLMKDVFEQLADAGIVLGDNDDNCVLHAYYTQEELDEFDDMSYEELDAYFNDDVE
ncbi:hypothetical protein LOU62_002097 [Salmonella enterica]|nr:hypothetical protein [Salmonella enterica]